MLKLTDRPKTLARPYAATDLRGGQTKPAGLPPWVGTAFGGFAAVLEDPSFPCTFARTAHKRDIMQYLFADSPECPVALADIADGLAAYLREATLKTGMEAAMSVLNVLFKPAEPQLSVAEYHAQAWAVLQRLHDHDRSPWPNGVPIDPNDPQWSFCFAGVPVFVNVSCPAHRIRRSRNLGPSLVLVVQPREGFDAVGGDHRQGDGVRQKIRDRISAYDGLSAAPELGTYGRADNLEWWQYTLAETNGDRTEQCPLKIRKG